MLKQKENVKFLKCRASERATGHFSMCFCKQNESTSAKMDLKQWNSQTVRAEIFESCFEKKY